MTCVRRHYDVQKIKMAAVLQLKITNYILETKLSFYIVTTEKTIRMCTLVTLSDMTSFVYIGDKSIICQNGLERKRNDTQQKEIVHSYLSD